MKAILRVLLFGVGFLNWFNPLFGQGKFSLSASVSPFYRYINTETNVLLPNISVGGGPAIPINEKYRQLGQGYSAGLMARYAVTAHWSISTGILLKHATNNMPTITTTPDFTTVSILPIITGPSHRNNYQIPILVNYQSSTSRLSPYFSAGVTLDVRSASFLDVGNGQELVIKSGKAVVVNPVVGIGGIYQLSKHLSLLAQPTFGYILLTGNEKVISNKNYLIGLQAQLLYTF